MAYTLRTDKSWAAIEADIREQLRRWGADTYSLGRPNARNKTARGWTETPEEAVVLLQAHWKSGRELSLTYNKQACAVDNARVLFLVVEALRLNEVRGIDDVMREAYLALPPPAEAVKARDPYEVIGVRPGAALEDVEDMYRIKARRLHPDSAGGDAKAMKELNEARDRILAERKDGSRG